MKIVRYPLIVLLVAFMLLSGGCADIDWKAHAKDLFVYVVSEVVTIAVDKFGHDSDKRTEAIEWAIEEIETLIERDHFEWIGDFVKYIDLRELVTFAYDSIFDKFYEMLRDAGFDTDAIDSGENKMHYIHRMNDPGLHAEMVLMLE